MDWSKSPASATTAKFGMSVTCAPLTTVVCFRGKKNRKDVGLIDRVDNRDCSFAKPYQAFVAANSKEQKTEVAMSRITANLLIAIIFVVGVCGGWARPAACAHISNISPTEFELSCVETTDQGIYSRLLNRSNEAMAKLRRIREFDYVWIRWVFWFDRCENGKHPKVLRGLILAVRLRNGAGQPESYRRGEVKGNARLDKVAIFYDFHDGRCPQASPLGPLCASFIIVMPSVGKLTSRQESLVVQTAYWRALRLIEGA